MSVQFKFSTILRNADARLKRNIWFHQRIPTGEYFIIVDTTKAYEDGLDLDDMVDTVVTIWADDAERIATEFWFQFP